MDSSADDAPALSHGAQRCRHQAADRCEDDRAIERLRRLIVRAPCPDRTKTSGKVLTGQIAGLRETKHIALLPTRDLRNDVRCRTKAEQTDIPSVAGQS
jgi:hypothetical protein